MKPVCLADKEVNTDGRVELNAVGWGRTDEKAGSSSKLKEVCTYIRIMVNGGMHTGGKHTGKEHTENCAFSYLPTGTHAHWDTCT